MRKWVKFTGIKKASNGLAAKLQVVTCTAPEASIDQELRATTHSKLHGPPFLYSISKA